MKGIYRMLQLVLAAQLTIGGAVSCTNSNSDNAGTETVDSTATGALVASECLPEGCTDDNLCAGNADCEAGLIRRHKIDEPVFAAMLAAYSSSAMPGKGMPVSIIATAIANVPDSLCKSKWVNLNADSTKLANNNEIEFTLTDVPPRVRIEYRPCEEKDSTSVAVNYSVPLLRAILKSQRPDSVYFYKARRTASPKRLDVVFRLRWISDPSRNEYYDISEPPPPASSETDANGRN
ncbi:MAG: hypothetical protein EOP49_10255 [Sphingobacteriales bacterium]|nr:MAG: hypothetical protein EOP49_10255 [Sphingobacteriales bacterium]